MTRWRKRIGEEVCGKLLSEPLRIAHSLKLLKTSHLESVIVDTTVQEKNITDPTDGKLLNRVRRSLVLAAKKHGIVLRQTKEKLVLLCGRRRLKPVLEKLLKRRSAIEPIIGHMKHDHRLSRNLLKGKAGDHINAWLARGLNLGSC